MNIGIVGARKYRDKPSVMDLLRSLPIDSVIITSGCRGVCTWAKEEAEKRNMKIKIYAPDLKNIRARFEIPKRYYQRNRELVEACDILYAFISQEGGFTGGTRFEVAYARKIGKMVKLHWEIGISEILYQYSFPFMDKEYSFSLDWQKFFCETLT